MTLNKIQQTEKGYEAIIIADGLAIAALLSKEELEVLKSIQDSIRVRIKDLATLPSYKAETTDTLAHLD